MSLGNKILALFRDYPKEEFRPIYIDRMLYGGDDYKKDKKRLMHITTELNRLVSRNKLVKRERGYYSLRITYEELYLLDHTPIMLHGMKIETKTVQTLQKTIDGITSRHYTDEMLDWFRALGFKKSTNSRWGVVLWWEGRRIRVTVHLCGLVEVFIHSSKNPLSFPDMHRCLEYLNGFMHPICLFDRRKTLVRQVGMNVDFKELRLDGLSCITLHRYMNDWARIYYKEDADVTRFEHHLTVNMSLEDAFNSLSLLTAVPVRDVGVRPDERRDVV